MQRRLYCSCKTRDSHPCTRLRLRIHPQRDFSYESKQNGGWCSFICGARRNLNEQRINVAVTFDWSSEQTVLEMIKVRMQRFLKHLRFLRPYEASNTFEYLPEHHTTNELRWFVTWYEAAEKCRVRSREGGKHWNSFWDVSASANLS